MTKYVQEVLIKCPTIVGVERVASPVAARIVLLTLSVHPVGGIGYTLYTRHCYWVSYCSLPCSETDNSWTVTGERHTSELRW